MDADSISPVSVIPPVPRKSVPYGQACINCSKAKCKCVSRGGPGTACDRCQRLGKECHPSVGVRKRSVRRPASSRAAHLEEKLDDLVSILRAQAAGNPALSSYRAPVDAQLPGVATGGNPNIGAGLNMNWNIGGISGGNKAVINGHGLPSSEIPVPHRYPGSASSYSTPRSVASSQDMSLSPAEAEETLQLFRDKFLKFFPFMYLSPETTAADLERTKPFLWLNIRTICCKSISQKAALCQRVREVAAQRILVDLDRNMDVLLGLLTYLGWGMHHFCGRTYIVAYTGLALSVITDLRLDKSPQDNYYELYCFRPSNLYPKTGSTGRTNEERRAVLACFVACSANSTFLRSHSMRWTSHMEDSLEKLAADPKCPNDEVLVAMVRAQRIIEDVRQATWRTLDAPGQHAPPKPPPAFYSKALRVNLEGLRKSISPSLLENKIVISYLCGVELAIADMAFWNPNGLLSATHHLAKGGSSSSNGGGGGGGGAHHHASYIANSMNSLNNTMSSNIQSNTNNGASGITGGSSGGVGTTTDYVDVSRADAYYASLQAGKASLENHLSFAAGDYIGFSFPHALHFMRALQALYRLAALDGSSSSGGGGGGGAGADARWWDGPAAVRAAVDLPAAVERVTDNYARVAARYGLESGPDAFDYYTRAASSLRATVALWNASLDPAGCSAAAAATAALEASLAAVAAGPGAQTPAGTAAAPAPPGPPDQSLDIMSMDWFDDPWLADFMRSFEPA
ncbi:hypothetical protein GGS23DRAFT_594894 [Durotheca rogersii]|uniref:uncharacterized protein n=1 Tax=Durotheca rogersii TaxID=419775 RepID=UPI0022201E0B|nr:uncharacterized protein GGS23DRAFT_594894 [Durotheca rogersii]KAI5865361.1 hypothetical protein GGS23DRAFT_594894 [Durotheca rogersii]